MLNTFREPGSWVARLLRAGGLGDVVKRSRVGRPLASLARQLIPAKRRQERAFRRDFRAFQAQHPYLAAAAPAGIGKHLLVCSLSDWVAQVKLESVLAKALQFQGLTPTIATYTHQERGHRIHRLFGFHDFAYLDRLMRPAEKRWALAAAARFADGRPQFRDVLDFEHRGVQVGRHVLSSIVSTLRSGSVGFDDPRVDQLLRRGLAEALMTVGAAERLLDQTKPDVVLLLERGYVPFSEVFDVALNRGIPVVQYCQSHRSDGFLLKRFRKDIRNAHPSSLSPASWERVRAMPWSAALEDELMTELRGRYEQGQWFNRKYLQVGKRLKTADEVRTQLGLDPTKKTAVLFSHVLWDATFFFGTTLFDDYEQWLVETVKAACANTAVNWVIKLHPDYVWKMKKAGDTRRPPEYAALESRVGPLPPHVIVLPPQTDISTYSLFAVTDCCLTVRGTVGIEMPCFGIPVLTAGTGRYSGLGFTIDSTSREQYFDRLRHVQDIPRLARAEIELARRHAYALLRLRPCPFSSFTLVQDELDRLGHALDHNVRLHTKSLAEFRAAPDLTAFARWVAEEDAEDFLTAEAPPLPALRQASA